MQQYIWISKHQTLRLTGASFFYILGFIVYFIYLCSEQFIFPIRSEPSSYGGDQPQDHIHSFPIQFGNTIKHQKQKKIKIINPYVDAFEKDSVPVQGWLPRVGITNLQALIKLQASFMFIGSKMEMSLLTLSEIHCGPRTL